MKKSFVVMGTAAAVALFVAGCMSKGNVNEVQKQYERFQTERPAVAAVNSGDKSLDNVAVASAKVYGSTVKYLDEYFTATTNHKDYVSFTADVQYEMEQDKSLTQEQATAKALEFIKKNDEGKPEGEKAYSRVVAGYKAVNALSPAAKVKELAPLAEDAAKIATTAKGLSNSFTGLDAATIQKANSAKNVMNQAYYSGEALGFLKRQYEVVEYWKSKSTFTEDVQ